MLAQDEQEGGEEGEKLDLNAVDTNGDTPGIQMSNNKEKSTKRQGGTRENDFTEGNSQAGIKNIETSGHTENNHQSSKKGGGRTERSIDKDGSIKENYEGKDQRTEDKFNDSSSCNMLESCRKLGRNNFMEIEDIEIRKSPNLIEEDDEVLQHRKDTEEDEDIEYNIQQISKAGDLSPRHTNSLKYGARKGKRTLPLQVQTRSSREKASNSDQ
ncbi:hypothetical protein KY290_006337 [Solanum tuberosum]|uniref:Uncharacterized protein n=1 Tax=Solanum tuberosum TaxID=4113 RepID=A0ABQ7WIS0_SOLTU|nr:hypothetical protein KY284_006377 [Solanum tuberosum]KAH0723666.1 hypothetical protein KY289_006710 [Solanum tuberosum]KAH0751303.1 hypothetical protein KY285_004451 [Solanum tuberosum]KAH0779910.1 hypothetical protein KY290_006337 [Solanum tuberosum]